MVTYYYFFNIKISDYLQIQEFLSPFISDLVFYALFLFLPVLLVWIFLLDSPIGRWNTQIFNDKKKQSFKSRIKTDLKENWFTSLTYLGIAALWIYLKTPLILIISTIVYMPLLNVVYWLRRELLIKDDIQFTPKNAAMINVSTLFFTMFLLMISNTITDVYFTKNSHKKVEITLSNYQLNCGDSLSYVGRVNDYTFIYDKSLKSTSILSNSEIKSVCFK